MKLLSRAVVLVLLLATIAAYNAYAQDPNNSVAIGVPKFSTVTGGPDVINLGNLNVHWDFPIISKPGRGLPFELALTFDNSVWKNDGTRWSPTLTSGWAVQSAIPNGSIRSSHTQTVCGGSRFNTIYTDRWTNWTYIDGSNISHALTGAFYELNNCTNKITTSGPVTAADGSGYTLTPSVGIASVFTPSGSTLEIEGRVTRVTDSNGNWLNAGPGLSVIVGGSGPWFDTLGMTVVTFTGGNRVSGPPYASDTYVYTDANGVQQTVTLNYSGYTVQTNFGCPNVAEYSVPGSPPLVSSIVYPDGRTYSFTYEPTPGNPAAVTGRLGSVTLPTGGVIKYSYPGPNDGINCARTDSSTTGLTRQTPDGTTTYVRTNMSGTEWKTSVTYPPDSVTGQQNQTDLYFQNPSNQFFETKRQIFQGSDQGSPIETVQTCYNGSAPDCTAAPITLPITQTTELAQLASGQQRQTVTFRNTAGLVTETDEYDYGNGAPGPLLKKTITQYLTQGGNTVNRPTVITVQDGSGNQIAQTQYFYDESAPPALSNVPNHTAGAGASGLNATTVKHWVNTTNTFLTTINSYDDTGNLISTIDPLGHTTSFSYADGFADGVNRNSLAYVTQVTMPATAVQHITSAKYDANTGRKVGSVDQNGNQTAYVYDLMLRPLTVTLPADTSGNHPKTTLSYPDPNTITVQRTITSSVNDTETGKLDGLGRTIQTQHLTPSGTAKVDATYDSMGRLLTVSNPYFSTSDPTYGLTKTQYDALGRTIATTKQDGSISSASYTGNCTTATDEAGKQRKACSDGLGRLTNVWEDPSGMNYETDYQYDVLGNLLRVDQKSSAPNDSTQWRTRLFTYDSLSRLLTANNPESGTVAYQYDNDSNMISKLSPAPNQTGTATVTTTYSYDPLNRVTLKTYSDSTPTAYFAYDTSAGWGIAQTNTVGRLEEAWIGTPSAAAKASIFGYDSVGRIVMNNQCTPGNCGVSNFPLSYSYDLMGNMTSQTTGVGVAFTQTFDSAGRVTQITSSSWDAQHPATLATVDSSAGYYATGAMRKVTFANGLTETAAFNKRLQPCRTNVNSSGSILTLCNDAVPGGNVQDFSYGYNVGTADNGNVTSMTAVGAQVFNRSYTYDSLNRLLTLSAPGDACSGLSWTYDAWANRTDQTVTGGACNSFHQPVNTNNRISGTGYQYDAAGNMTNDGSHSYTYDAENRITAVDGGATASYVYDALGQRVRKTTGSTWTDYVYDLADHVVYEFTSTQGACFAPCPAAGYIYMDGNLVAEYKEGTTYFFHKDHLGSTRLMTRLDQTFRDSMDFLPYGEQIAGGSGSTHKYTGKERDAESGLDYFGARYYGSLLGRFVQADPLFVLPSRAIDPQQLNLYAYARNNPLRFIDPTGMKIDESELSDKDKKKFDHIREIANETDEDGNLTHQNLHDVLTGLEDDSRTFVIQNTDFGSGTGEVGLFTITNFTDDHKDFTSATLQLDFKRIEGISGASTADIQVKGFQKYAGLFGVKDEKGLRLAETFGHEGAHGIFAIHNLAQAIAGQLATNAAKDALAALPKKGRYPLPPDVAQKLDAANSGRVPSEQFAQQAEQKINRELQPPK